MSNKSADGTVPSGIVQALAIEVALEVSASNRSHDHVGSADDLLALASALAKIGTSQGTVLDPRTLVPFTVPADAPVTPTRRLPGRRRLTALVAASGVVLLTGTDLGVQLLSGVPSSVAAVGRPTVVDGHIALVDFKSVGSQALAQLQALDCPTRRNCVAVGASGDEAKVGISRDGGATWTLGRLPSDTVHLVAVQCVSAAHCWAIGSSIGGPAVVTTTNGGTSWTTQQVPAGVRAIHGLSCPSALGCFAVGNGNAGAAILTTTRGGPWTLASPVTSVRELLGISCVSATECTAVGVAGSDDGGATLTTNDAGANWAAQPTPVGFTPTTVMCSTTSSCWISGTGPTGRAQVATWTGATGNGATWIVTTGSDSGAMICPPGCSGELGVTANPLVAAIESRTKIDALATSAAGALSCPSPSQCWAVQRMGSAVVGLAIDVRGV